MMKIINTSALALFAGLMLFASGAVKHQVNHYDSFDIHHITISGISIHNWYVPK